MLTMLAMTAFIVGDPLAYAQTQLGKCHDFPDKFVAQSDLSPDCAGLIQSVIGLRLRGRTNDETLAEVSSDTEFELGFDASCANFYLVNKDSTSTSPINIDRGIDYSESRMDFGFDYGAKEKKGLYTSDDRASIDVTIDAQAVSFRGHAKDVRKGRKVEINFGIPSVEKFSVNHTYETESCRLVKAP